jgi:hypothetical protein
MLCTRFNRRTQRQPANCNRTVAAPPEIAALLLPGERLVTDPVAAHGWRYESVEVPFERNTLMVGGPLLFVLTGIGSAIRNRSARRAAEAQAAPRWRPLGPLTVLATTDRLLVWHQDAWRSVWYSAITSSSCEARRLELTFADSAPYLLDGAVTALSAAIGASRHRSAV